MIRTRMTRIFRKFFRTFCMLLLLYDQQLNIMLQNNSEANREEMGGGGGGGGKGENENEGSQSIKQKLA